MTDIILGIDPGTTQSAWLVLDGRTILAAAIDPNADVLQLVRGGWAATRDGWSFVFSTVAIERIEPRFGLNVGWSTLLTCEFVGALTEAARPLPVALLRRSVILGHLGVATRGRGDATRTSADSGVRAALMERWGGEGSVRKGGPLVGIKTHLWSALSVAVTFAEAPELAELIP